MEAPNDQPLPPPTLTNLQVSARGFADEESANAIAHAVGQLVGYLSRFFELQRVDGVTIAHDYDAALAELDRGFKATRPLAATKDNGMIGVAMAPLVLRDGIVKSRLMFAAPIVLPLLDPESEDFDQALYLVAHECAHADDLKQQDESFPGVLLNTPYPNFEADTFGPIARAIWNEYAACRMSAPFKAKDTFTNFDQTLANVLQSARANSNAAIIKYRLHHDLTRLVAEAGDAISAPLEYAGYVIGHLHGLEQTLEGAPLTHAALVGNPYQPLLAKIEGLLADLWTRRGAWKSVAEFDPLISSVKTAFADGGLVFSTSAEGKTHITVPFTPETMPKSF